MTAVHAATAAHHRGGGRRLTIGVLGPLETRIDGRPVPIGGGLKRMVLALLAVHANEPVSSSQLTARLWGEDPPATERASLRRLVTELGWLLPTGAGGCDLVRCPSVYELRLPPQSVDLHLSRHLAERGRRALQGRRPREASELLGQALALWRGPVLADLAAPAREWPETAGLGEEHSTLLEDRLGADLASGAHDEVIEELAPLTRADPARERLHAMLVRALCATGRAEDAAAAYHWAAHALAEWGVSPGPDLQAARRQLRSTGPSTAGAGA